MNTLKQRLNELIGEDEITGKRGTPEYVRKYVIDFRNWLRARQRQALDATIAHIAADVEGLIGPDEPTMGAQNEAGHVAIEDYEAAARNTLKAELRAALARYMKGTE